MRMEEQIQEGIVSKLESWNLSPFSVTCTFRLGGDNGSGLLSITFFIKQDLDELLKRLDYTSQCDKSGYCILDDNNTIILTGMALLNLYTST